MDFDLDDDQRAVLDAVAMVLERHAGPARARALGPSGHDEALLAALGAAGFLDLARHAEAGPLVAALVVEEVARTAGACNIGARAMVAPAVFGDEVPPRVAVASDGTDAPIRFGADADAVIAVEGDEASVVTPDPTGVAPVASVYGYPFARIDLHSGERRPLPLGSGADVRRWWQAAVASETVGAMSAALALTVDYLRHRVQFGRPLASLQAIQHRLAEAEVWLEGLRWLSRAAAWSGAEPERAASAATYAVLAIDAVAADLHQLTGAIGFTIDYDLHLWTTRLWALRHEAGGIDAHAAAVTASRWAG